MTVQLIALALLTSGILAVGAWGVDRLLRPAGMGTRFVWLGGLGAGAALLVAAPLRLLWSRREVAAGIEPAVELAPATSFVAELSEVATIVVQRLPAWTASALLSVWIAASLATLAALVIGAMRHRRTALASPAAELLGAPVRVSEAFGPAVIGVWSPMIIVPRWLLARSAEEQRLVIAHESAHIEARDPLLLVAGAGLVVLTPWNPVSWWCFARLRLATELDCDARVLRAGAPPRTYGSLLLDLTAALPMSRIGSPAFAARPSQLEQRLLAMTTRPVGPRRRRATLLAAAMIAATALIAACSAEVQEPLTADAAARAEPTAATVYFDFQVEKPVAPVPGMGSPRYPDILHSASVEGQVIAQFVVDTTGRIDGTTFKVISSSHDLFTASVRNAIPAMRFTPAEIGGVKVKQLVQQPFVYNLSK
jgi:TonB family protein